MVPRIAAHKGITIIARRVGVACCAKGAFRVQPAGTREGTFARRLVEACATEVRADGCLGGRLDVRARSV